MLKKNWKSAYIDLRATLNFYQKYYAIVIFRLKSISDLDSGSLPRLYGESIHIRKIKNLGFVATTGNKMAKTTLTSG